MTTVRIPNDLRDRIDAIRPATVSREAWVREACEGKLESETEIVMGTIERRSGIALIATERRRQIEQEGWTPEHDDQHEWGELARGAACYADPPLGSGWEGALPSRWPWERRWWKPRDRIDNLVRAGALVAAEIDRLQRRDSSHA